MITGGTVLAGVVGWPVAHSRSPRLHNAWLARHGIDGAYLPLPVRPGELPVAIAGLRAAGFAGVNVTIPHKEAALGLCDTLDAAARRAGAANTLVFGADGVHGGNTDGAGFLANLAAHGVAAPRAALVLGAGGAARAIAAALIEAGAEVAVANRTSARADALCAALPELRVVGWDRRGAALSGCDLLVNATSLGMAGHAPLDIDLRPAPRGLAVADIVYAPQRTPLLAQAEALGLRAVPGLGMLLHQAVPGFAAWFGVTPSVDRRVIELVAADTP